MMMMIIHNNLLHYYKLNKLWVMIHILIIFHMFHILLHIRRVYSLKCNSEVLFLIYMLLMLLYFLFYSSFYQCYMMYIHWYNLNKLNNFHHIDIIYNQKKYNDDLRIIYKELMMLYFLLYNNGQQYHKKYNLFCRQNNQYILNHIHHKYFL